MQIHIKDNSNNGSVIIKRVTAQNKVENQLKQINNRIREINTELRSLYE